MKISKEMKAEITAAMKIKIYKSMNELNTVSDVIEKVLTELEVVVE